MTMPERGHLRYVALGDSQTEGIGDGDDLLGHRGWADRLAQRLAAANPGLLSVSPAATTPGPGRCPSHRPTGSHGPSIANCAGSPRSAAPGSSGEYEGDRPVTAAPPNAPSSSLSAEPVSAEPPRSECGAEYGRGGELTSEEVNGLTGATAAGLRDSPRPAR
ncbi:SGNH/GDSL hydrolase family protein [Sphaerisporangium sp. NPDC088356]|uniref:SGNH/GDSL hydrolase family protein n=1 Tax=Sphaerisporangium sp. NPDC088356 TaxID=3154871 RepID=UPI003428174A